jgi:hypothetical protein
MDEQASSIVFNTLKNLKEQQKRRKSIEQLKSVQIEWEAF